MRNGVWLTLFLFPAIEQEFEQLVSWEADLLTKSIFDPVPSVHLDWP
jgi:hypothetical protein